MREKCLLNVIEVIRHPIFLFFFLRIANFSASFVVGVCYRFSSKMISLLLFFYISFVLLFVHSWVQFSCFSWLSSVFCCCCWYHKTFISHQNWFAFFFFVCYFFALPRVLVVISSHRKYHESWKLSFLFTRLHFSLSLSPSVRLERHNTPTNNKNHQPTSWSKSILIRKPHNQLSCWRASWERS
jgi:hypothetical protein